MKVAEGIPRIRKLCNNAKLLVRGTPEVGGYGLVAAQTTLILAHRKGLVKIGLYLAVPPGCCDRIVCPYRLALEKIIDISRGVGNPDFREKAVYFTQF